GRAQFALILSSLSGVASLAIVFRGCLKDLDQTVILYSRSNEKTRAMLNWDRQALFVVFALAVPMAMRMHDVYNDGWINRHAGDRSFRAIFAIAVMPLWFWALTFWRILYRVMVLRDEGPEPTSRDHPSLRAILITALLVFLVASNLFSVRGS